MDDEIDLRVYVEVLLRYWKWILGLALVAAVVAFVASLFLPATYEASAVVLVTEARYQMQFDPRIDTGDRKPAYKAFPTLATSDSILQDVLDTCALSPDVDTSAWTLHTLAGMVQASSEGDPSLVVLKVTLQSPKETATVANAWADVLVKRGNEIYGQSEENVTFFETQAAQARAKLEQAEAALIDFEARNQASIIDIQLASLLQAQSDYLETQRTISYILQDIQGLRTQLSQQPDDQMASLADSLTVLLLQIKAFNAQSSTPIQLQIDSSAEFSHKTSAEQSAFLDELAMTLQAKSAEIDGRLAELKPRILALQRELKEANAEGDELTRARDVARETYLTLTRKLDEARIAAQEENGVLQVGSYAAIPEKPVGPQKKLITGVAGMLGLAVGVFGAFLAEFWRRRST